MQPALPCIIYSVKHPMNQDIPFPFQGELVGCLLIGRKNILLQEGKDRP